jgi:hypothetical protein
VKIRGLKLCGLKYHVRSSVPVNVNEGETSEVRT